MVSQRDKALWRVVLTSYPCPTCDAEPGEDCRTNAGKRAAIPHADRGRTGERCSKCGTPTPGGDPMQLCPRCELIRALEVERSTTHKRET